MQAYKPVSKAMPIMPETALLDSRKGTIPKAHKVKLALSDLYRDENVYSQHVSKAHYKERGY